MSEVARSVKKKALEAKVTRALGAEVARSVIKECVGLQAGLALRKEKNKKGA